MSNIINPHRFAATGVTEDDILALDVEWWVDASQQSYNSGTTQATNGQAVYKWVDKTDTLTFDEVSASYNPVWYASGQNGKPYVAFDADKLNETVGDDYSTPASMFFVQSWSDVTSTSGSHNHNKRPFNATSSSFYTWMEATYGPSAFRTDFGIGDTIIPNAYSTSVRIFEWFVTGTSGVGELRYNGGAALTPHGSFTGTPADDDWIADGQNFSFGNSQGTFHLYDFMFIDATSLSTGDRNDVFTYFGDRYDISVSDIS